MNFAQSLHQEFELRVFQESYERIEKCLNAINQSQLWQAPNENMVSIGCLIKHLLGNMQQWVYAGVMNGDFERHRDAEFVPELNLTKDDLLRDMKTVQTKVLSQLEGISEEHLQQNLIIQGFDTTGLSAMIHVIEHFSYHTGQISLLTKMFQNIDLGYYDDHNLNA